jgi:hypothetical protein
LRLATDSQNQAPVEHGRGSRDDLDGLALAGILHGPGWKLRSAKPEVYPIPARQQNRAPFRNGAGKTVLQAWTQTVRCRRLTPAEGIFFFSQSGRGFAKARKSGAPSQHEISGLVRAEILRSIIAKIPRSPRGLTPDRGFPDRQDCSPTGIYPVGSVFISVLCGQPGEAGPQDTAQLMAPCRGSESKSKSRSKKWWPFEVHFWPAADSGLRSSDSALPTPPILAPP